MTHIAVVGDVHGGWGPEDCALFEADPPDLVLIVGDLAGLWWPTTLRVARGIGALRVPTLVLPGNHDASTPIQLLGEVTGQPAMGAPFAGVQGRRLDALAEAVAPATLGAYSRHPVGEGAEAVDLIAGRPHSMGGPTLAFTPHLTARWGVDSLEASVARLRELIDAAGPRLVFASHNGPSGLGATRSDPWGCDFRAAEGDWGDPDMEQAIAYARETGREVLAVVAGHMHRSLKGGGQRTWQHRDQGILYVNAACVPRVRDGRRHHVSLTLADQASAEDVWR